MPIIVDTNCLANVFSMSSQKHNQFKPVLDWILLGKGKIVYGGSKYKRELKNATKYQYLFRLMKECGKVIVGDDKEIDKHEHQIQSKNNNKEFNDAHLLAIAISTKCRIICSEDTTSIKFVTDMKNFPQKMEKPVYYTSKKNATLLCDHYVHKDLKPLCKINKSLAEKIKNSLPH